MTRTSDDLICVVEPQCGGFEHAHFNAALLATMRWAYPEAQVVFLAEREHWEWVRSMLERFDGPALHRIEWQESAIPPHDMAGWRRFRSEWGGIRAALQCAAERQAWLLAWTSITDTGLFALKLQLYLRRPGFPVLAVIHAILATIVKRPPCRFRNRIFWLRRVLQMPHPASLQYIALGASIHRSLTQVQPAVATHFKILDHPYFQEDRPPHAPDEGDPPRPLRFGYFGVSPKGFDAFAQLAREILTQNAQVEFILVGFLRDGDAQSDYPGITGLSDKPLTPEEYRRRAATLTYAVGTADPAHYRLVANATFLDALSFGKPGVYLRNAFVADYFRKMGDIGYLCDSYEEMRATVLSLVREFPTERYRKQRDNIRRGREIFAPQLLARGLREIVEGAKR